MGEPRAEGPLGGGLLPLPSPMPGSQCTSSTWHSRPLWPSLLPFLSLPSPMGALHHCPAPLPPPAAWCLHTCRAMDSALWAPLGGSVPTQYVVLTAP